MRNTMISALAAVAVFGIAPASLAAEPVEVRVDFSDLDLNDASDVNELETRVRDEIKEACGEGAFGIMSRFKVRTCIRDAMEEATAQIEAQRSFAASSGELG